MCRLLLVTLLVGIVCLVGSASSSGDDVMTSSNDLDLIKLYLEEFRLELMSVKSQLVRMARNSKLLRTTLKELRSSKCGHNSDALGTFAACSVGLVYSSLVDVENGCLFILLQCDFNCKHRLLALDHCASVDRNLAYSVHRNLESSRCIVVLICLHQ